MPTFAIALSWVSAPLSLPLPAVSPLFVPCPPIGWARVVLRAALPAPGHHDACTLAHAPAACRHAVHAAVAFPQPPPSSRLLQLHEAVPQLQVLVESVTPLTSLSISPSCDRPSLPILQLPLIP